MPLPPLPRNGLSMLVLAVLSGVFMSLIGVSYRLGTPRGFHSLQIVLCVCLAGMGFFGIRCTHSVGHVPALVIALGILTGFSQYAIMLCIQIGLNKGPMSALWCALMLGFLPSLIYASVVLGEPFLPIYVLTIGLAIGSVLFAALHSERQTPAGDSDHASRARMRSYVLLLVTVMLLNGVPPACMKTISMAGPTHTGAMWQSYSSVFFFLLYGVLFVCAGIDQLRVRRPFPTVSGWLALGALAGTGSVVGLWMFSKCVSGPAAQMFTANGIASILAASCFGVVLFREKRTWFWYGVVACSIACVATTGFVST